MTPINKALSRPLLIAGVEKRLVVLNSLICFPLVAATHLHFPSCLFGIVLFAVLHLFFTRLSKHDPYFGLVVRRSSRYLFNPGFYAKSHPTKLPAWPVKVLP